MLRLIAKTCRLSKIIILKVLDKACYEDWSEKVCNEAKYDEL